MLENLVITDKVIIVFKDKPMTTRLRCTKYKELQFRFNTNREKGGWYVYSCNTWRKVGSWPTIKTKDIRAALPDLLVTMNIGKNSALIHAEFQYISDLLVWYGKRMEDNRNLSEQRLKDIKSALKCHLLPKVGRLSIDDISLSTLDKNLIWPSQKILAKATVIKHFSILKAAFKDAFDLKLINSNQLASFKISDFGEFQTPPKESKVKPKQVKAILEEVIHQRPITYMITTIMITLGTRLGETRKAKWSQLHLDDTPEWNIPAKNTKNGKAFDIKLPEKLAGVLIEWKKHQRNRGVKSDYLFPDRLGRQEIGTAQATELFRSFSGGKWSSHDLRKVARNCWANQGVDYMVGERMLNHSLGKVAETYLDSAAGLLRLKALDKHVVWIEAQHNKHFDFNVHYGTH
jgi:integrase